MAREVGQRVRVLPSHYDGRLRGRVGTIVKVPKLMPEYPYVHLDPRPRERTKKVEMIEDKHLEPHDSPAPAVQAELSLERAS